MTSEAAVNVEFVPRGKPAFDDAMGFQAAWVNRLLDGTSVQDIETARSVMMGLRKNLEEGTVAGNLE